MTFTPPAEATGSMPSSLPWAFSWMPKA